MRDAAQAYIQARIDGPGRPRTWVRLPKAWWPSSWYNAKGESLYYDPVCPLVKALYGHPESGAIWEKHLSKVLTDLGWQKVPSHPGTWIHARTSAILAVYVDDLLMAAPAADEASLWKSLEEKICFDEPAMPISKFLGAHHTFMKHGTTTHHSVQMCEFLKDAALKTNRRQGSARLHQCEPRIFQRTSQPRARRSRANKQKHAVLA